MKSGVDTASTILRFRVTPDQRERIVKNAQPAPFNGNESLFIRFATDLVMDLREELGPRFDLAIAAIRDTDEKEAA